MNDINIVDELKDLLNRMCVTNIVEEEEEELKNMKNGQIIVQKKYVSLMIDVVKREKIDKAILVQDFTITMLH